MAGLLPVYNRIDLDIAYGKGSYIYGRNGKRYLDCTSGVAVNCLGHCHPDLVAALKEQSETLWHISNLFVIEQAEELAALYTENSFADYVFFCNSGTEAVECAIKTVRKYHDANGEPEKFRIISFTGAFHGRTLAAIWAGKRDPYMQEGFGPPVDGFDNVEFNNLQAVYDAITPETGAILVEPVQGDGGIRPCDPVFLQGLRDICDEKGLLLCFDEVQCGAGRTGTLFAHERYGIMPDIMSMAKGIGGGIPLGACLTTKEAAKGMTAGTHGTTYGGNPLATKIGKTVFDHISQQHFLRQVQETGVNFSIKLENLRAAMPDVIKDVRGVGCLKGVGLHSGYDAKDVCRRAPEHGLLAAPAADNVVRLLPPLNISAEETAEAVEMLGACLRTLRDEKHAGSGVRQAAAIR